jgi:hypothetical protein
VPDLLAFPRRDLWNHLKKSFSHGSKFGEPWENFFFYLILINHLPCANDSQIVHSRIKLGNI